MRPGVAWFVVLPMPSKKALRCTAPRATKPPPPHLLIFRTFYLERGRSDGCIRALPLNSLTQLAQQHIHFISSCAADDSQPQSYWFVRASNRCSTCNRVAVPQLCFRYHAFDKLYEILLTELHEDAGTSGHEMKHGLQGFLRDAVVCR
jgi:hypothetical protein